MAETTKAVSVRVPIELIDYLEKMAEKARRSLSSEIVFRLEETKKTDR
jgi:hypothetical protein